LAVSANALFHFTDSIDILKSIVRNGFYPRYCMEKKDFLRVYPANKLRYSASPMVCFCDIPLSLVKKHALRYGKYGIGINKSWAQQYGINPVTYISSESTVSKQINYSYAAIRKYQSKDHILIREMNDLEREMFDLAGETLDAIHYLKPYEGKNWINKSFAGEKICFYDEREWRFVPPQAAMVYAGVGRFIPRELFLDTDCRNDLNKALETCKLPINERTIQYIIVDKNNEMRKMVNVIMNLDEICGCKLSIEDKGMLCTKVISMERIESDF
jgi:hypothetical protein